MRLLAVLVLSSMFAAAQTKTTTTTTTLVQPQSIVLSLSCLNLGKGLTLTLTGRLLTVDHRVLVNGTGRSSLFYVGDLVGSGSNGLTYKATGSHDVSVLNWTPWLPDGTLAAEGDYTFTNDFVITGYRGTTVVERRWVRNTQAFTYMNGVTITSIDETLCK
jgi:hypothetical protein